MRERDQVSDSTDKAFAIGIDPGLHGAVAVISRNGTTPVVFATPTYVMHSKNKTKRDYKISDMAVILFSFLKTGARAHVFL